MLILQRPWTAQPQTFVRPAQRWLDRGLVYAANLGVSTQNLARPAIEVVTGCRRGVTARGMALGFGSTNGVGTTDCVNTQLGWVTGRTFVFSIKRTGAGGSAFGRIFDHSDQPTTTNGAALWWDNAAAKYTIAARFEITNDDVSFTTSKTEFTLGIAHAHKAGVVPLVYIDGVAVAITGGASSLGVALIPAARLHIGNRPADKARVWDGFIGESLVFDALLTGSELAELTGNVASSWEDRRIYIPTPAAGGGGAPTLSDLKAASITSSSVQFTYDYAF